MLKFISVDHGNDQKNVDQVQLNKDTVVRMEIDQNLQIPKSRKA